MNKYQETLDNILFYCGHANYDKYLNPKVFEELNTLFGGLTFALEHSIKVFNLINLKKFEIFEFEYIQEAPHLYSLLLKLVRNVEDAEK